MHWLHAAHTAPHNQKENPKMAGVMLIVIGLFLAPFLVGIPMIFWGAYLLAK